MTKNEWKKYIETHGIQNEFNVNAWGSCQYDGALQFFELFFKIREDISLKDTLEVLNLKFIYESIQKIDDVKRQMIKDSIERIYEDLEDDFYGVKYEAEKIQRIADAGEADYLFNALRKSAWDLWSTAPYISALFFKGLEIGSPKAPGIGPIINIQVQSENFIVGLHCVMLYELKIVNNSTFAYGDFDT